MSHYRKVDTRIWNDEKFIDLPQTAKLLFLMLLTHPNMTGVGAMRGTAEGLCSEMGMVSETIPETIPETILDTLSGRLNAFSKLVALGMVEYDAKACLLALPNFLKYNPPENKNVVKGWEKALEKLPECELKNRVIARCFTVPKPTPNRPPNGMGNGSPNPPPTGMPIQRTENSSTKDPPPVPPASGGGADGRETEPEKPETAAEAPKAKPKPRPPRPPRPKPPGDDREETLEDIIGPKDGKTAERFWKLATCWPRDKLHSPKTLARAWMAAWHGDDGVVRDIYAAALDYRDGFLPPARDGDETRYMKNPLTWLREEAWKASRADDDGPPPPRRVGGTGFSTLAEVANG